MKKTTTDNRSRTNPQASDDAPSKSYVPPKLEALGDLETLTAGPAGGTIDGLAGGDGGFQTIS